MKIIFCNNDYHDLDKAIKQIDAFIDKYERKKFEIKSIKFIDILLSILAFIPISVLLYGYELGRNNVNDIATFIFMIGIMYFFIIGGIFGLGDYDGFFNSIFDKLVNSNSRECNDEIEEAFDELKDSFGYLKNKRELIYQVNRLETIMNMVSLGVNIDIKQDGRSYNIKVKCANSKLDDVVIIDEDNCIEPMSKITMNIETIGFSVGTSTFDRIFSKKDCMDFSFLDEDITDSIIDITKNANTVIKTLFDHCLIDTKELLKIETKEEGNNNSINI